MLGQRRVVVGAQLGAERRVLLGADVARARPAGTRFGGEGIRRRQPHVPFDGGHANGKALGHDPRGTFLVDYGMDNSFAQITRISIHP